MFRWDICCPRECCMAGRAILLSERQHLSLRTAQIQTKEPLLQKPPRQESSWQQQDASAHCRSRQAQHSVAGVQPIARWKIFRPRYIPLVPLQLAAMFPHKFSSSLPPTRITFIPASEIFFTRSAKRSEGHRLVFQTDPGAIAISLSFCSIRFSEKNRFTELTSSGGRIQ